MSFDRTALFHLATSERFERAIKMVPGGEAIAWRGASHYVAGRSREEALAAAGLLLEQGHGVSLDLFGERVTDAAIADRVLADYLELAAALPPPPADAWLSVDLSHLALGADAVLACLLSVAERSRRGEPAASSPRLPIRYRS